MPARGAAALSAARLAFGEMADELLLASQRVEAAKLVSSGYKFQFPELERALRGEQRIAPRRMLDCELVRGGRQIASYEALNDVVITKSAIARMIELETHVDSQWSSCSQSSSRQRPLAANCLGVPSFLVPYLW